MCGKWRENGRELTKRPAKRLWVWSRHGVMVAWLRGYCCHGEESMCVCIYVKYFFTIYVYIYGRPNLLMDWNQG